MKKSIAPLVKLFQLNGYVRVQNKARKQALGAKYRKGWEVRFVLNTPDEVEQLQQLLRDAGFRPGKPFKKHSRLVQPVYGKAVVDYFHPQMKRKRRKRAHLQHEEASLESQGA
jgi:hypothetical protein